MRYQHVHPAAPAPSSARRITVLAGPLAVALAACVSAAPTGGTGAGGNAGGGATGGAGGRGGSGASGASGTGGARGGSGGAGGAGGASGQAGTGGAGPDGGGGSSGGEVGGQGTGGADGTGGSAGTGGAAGAGGAGGSIAPPPPQNPNCTPSKLYGKNGELWKPDGRLIDAGLGRLPQRHGAHPQRRGPGQAVTEFGAKGDDTADDTQAFLDAIAATPSGVLLVPAGRYVLTKQLFFTKSNFVFRGEGQGKTILYFPRPLTEVGVGGTSWSFNGGFLTVNGTDPGEVIGTVTANVARGAHRAAAVRRRRRQGGRLGTPAADRQRRLAVPRPVRRHATAATSARTAARRCSPGTRRWRPSAPAASPWSATLPFEVNTELEAHA